MEKAVIFFCDIQGTYSYGDETAKRTFCSYLSELKNIYKTDKVIFSFITGDSDRTYLTDYIKDINKYIDTNKISMGAQFYSMGYIDEDNTFKYCNETKPNQIVTYINILKEKYKIEKVFFADDRISLSDYENIQKSFEYDLDLTIFIPGSYYNERSNKKITSTSDGVAGLNECFEFMNNLENIKKCDLKKLKETLQKEMKQQEMKQQEMKQQEMIQRKSQEVEIVQNSFYHEEPYEEEPEDCLFINEPSLEDDSYFDYVISREEETFIQSDDFRDINYLLDLSLDEYFLSDEFYDNLYLERDDREIEEENREIYLFFKYYSALAYKDALIEKSKDYIWYDEYKFKEDFSRNKYINNEMLNLNLYPEMDTDLCDLLYGSFYYYDGVGMEYKEPDTYSVKDIRFVMDQMPIDLFLMQYVEKIKISGEKYKVRCSQIRHSNNMHLVAYPKSKQLYCPSCRSSMNLLNYILENECEQKNNIMGIFELMDTLIDTFNIEGIKLRDNYTINEKLRERILLFLNSDTYKSFKEDEQSYSKTKKIIPKYKN